MTRNAKVQPIVVEVAKGEKVLNVAAKVVRARKTKVVAPVVVEKPKNPIQIRHIRADLQPAGKYVLKGTDTVTDCGRIVVKQMTRKNPPTGKTVAVCPHCVERGHVDRAFQIARGAVKLIPAA